MAVLVTGSTGRLGQELLKVFPQSYAPPRSELDIRLSDKVHEFIRRRQPETIIHAAALTGIRQCEENKEIAWSTNVVGTENLVNSCRGLSERVYFVYISTACVFYGDRGEYSEDDVPNPKNFYALTKLVGEAVVRGSGLPRWLIVRTNFVAREKWPYPRAFVDRWGTHLFADDLARAIRSLIQRGLEGTVHVCGKRKMSMFELARLTNSEVQPMTMKDYAGPPLTIDMSLVSRRIESYELRETIPAVAY